MATSCDDCPSFLSVSPSNPCKNVLGKIGRIFFQKAVTSNNWIDGTNDLSAADSWAGLTASGDATHVTVTDVLLAVEKSDANYVTGSQNIDGADTINGVSAQEFTLTWQNPTPAQVQAMENIKCSDDGTLGVLLVDKNGKMQANVITDTPQTYSFIPVSIGTFVVGTPVNDGAFGSQDVLTIKFSLAYDWYQESEVVIPEAGFNPYNDITG